MRVHIVIALLAMAASALADVPLDEGRIAAARFGNDAAWYAGNVPFFESADARLDDIYYYRWQIFRAHQRDLGALGTISTEFLDDVGWQLDPYASLNDATGFHIYEGRWLRRRRYANDYIDFMSGPPGNDRHFAEAIADAVYARFLADGDIGFAASHLPALKATYGEWDDHFDRDKKLYWIMPLLDATEYTIASIDASGGKDGFWGGEAFRSSINSYMVANAHAISRMAALTGDGATAGTYAAKADALRAEMVKSLWSPAFNHFIDRYRVSNQFVKYWEPVRGRELVGYLPWAYGAAPSDPRYAEAFRYLLSPDGLSAPGGLRTVGPSYEYYMKQYRYDDRTGLRECQWNGPVWPFQTTQALIAMANLLNGVPQSVVGPSDYMRLLRQYAALHLRDGKPDLEEDYDPATGKPIVGLPRSHHYFHSGFNDLVITGLAGIRPREDDVLEVRPLVPSDPADPQYLRYFALQSVPYHGHLIGVVFDADGRKYGFGAGLTVLVDGKVAAQSPTVARLTVPLAHKAPFAVERPVDLAFNLNRTGYPHGNASTNADAPGLYRALDGRVWFFPEIPNGWESAGAKGEQWFAVDFGKPVTAKTVEVSFFADAGRYAAPEALRVQVQAGTKWVDIARRAHPLANGVNTLAVKPVPSRQVRILFRIPPRKDVRLVEMKVY